MLNNYSIKTVADVKDILAQARYTKDGKWTTAVAIRNSLKRMELDRQMEV